MDVIADRFFEPAMAGGGRFNHINTFYQVPHGDFGTEHRTRPGTKPLCLPFVISNIRSRDFDQRLVDFGCTA